MRPLSCIQKLNEVTQSKASVCHFGWSYRYYSIRAVDGPTLSHLQMARVDQEHTPGQCGAILNFGFLDWAMNESLCRSTDNDGAANFPTQFKFGTPLWMELNWIESSSSHFHNLTCDFDIRNRIQTQVLGVLAHGCVRGGEMCQTSCHLFFE